MNYVRITHGLNDRGFLLPEDQDVYAHIESPESDYYKSVFRYTEAHKKVFDEKGSIAGITDVTTNKLVFDFDSEDNVEAARADAVELCTRLTAQGVPPANLQICFSGAKGFSVEVETTSDFTPVELKSMNLALAGDLKTNDTSVLNASRIFRVPQTKHNKSGLYKLPISMTELCQSPADVIKERAQELNVDDSVLIGWHPIDLPESIIALKTPTTKPLLKIIDVVDTADLNFNSRPKGFTNCKFAIMNGFFGKGSRSNALTALAATCKYLSYPKEITYNMLKGAARLSSERTGADLFPKAEIWNNIIGQVYGPTWNGAQFSCRNQPWLHELCESLGKNKCKADDGEKVFFDIKDAFSSYEDFAFNIEKNTIKTGIKVIDDKVRITTNQSMAVLGAPGSGKTSFVLRILNNTSNMGINSVFISADMAAPLLIQKQMQHLTGKNGERLYEMARSDHSQLVKHSQELFEQYKNVKFSFKSGLTVEQIRQSVMSHQELTGKKVQLVVIDYLECLGGPYADSIQNTSYIANGLKDIANEMGLCSLLLVQPPKSAGSPADPLTSMRQIKGSSTLEQSFGLILGIYREGYNPNRPEDDKYITVNALKNRMGELFKQDLYWDGMRGDLRQLTDDEYADLDTMRERISKEKSEKNKDGF